jgi:hypothetical protein
LLFATATCSWWHQTKKDRSNLDVDAAARLQTRAPLRARLRPTRAFAGCVRVQIGTSTGRTTKHAVSDRFFQQRPSAVHRERGKY